MKPVRASLLNKTPTTKRRKLTSLHEGVKGQTGSWPEGLHEGLRTGFLSGRFALNPFMQFVIDFVLAY
jgi:hypothetical protein